MLGGRLRQLLRAAPACHAVQPGAPPCCGGPPRFAGLPPSRPPAPLLFSTSPFARKAHAADAPKAQACWSCGSPRADGDLYFCSGCSVILPPDPSHDYFALLGQPRHFDVPEPSLELAFKQAARSLHPDKFASRPEAERAASAAQASRLNAAYAALRSPLRRARYLLALRGDAPSRETEAGDPEDLEAQLEAREEAEAAKRDAPRLRSLAAKAEAAEAEALSSLRVAFAPGAAHDSSAAARAAVRALSYASKLGEEIREALHDAEAANHAAAEAAAARRGGDTTTEARD